VKIEPPSSSFNTGESQMFRRSKLPSELAIAKAGLRA
jgi:hypothetical protein